MLEDEQARQRLIEDLRRMEAERGPAEAEATPELALAEQIASAARTTAQAVAAQFRGTVAAVTGLTLPGAVNWGAVGEAALQLGRLIVVTLALSFVLRWLGRLPYGRADRFNHIERFHNPRMRRRVAV